MEREISAFEAETRIAALLDRAAAGESVTILRKGEPIARIVPAQPIRADGPRTGGTSGG